METYSSMHAWETHGQRGLTSNSPDELQRVRHDLLMYIDVFIFFSVARVLQNLKETGKTNFNQIN